MATGATGVNTSISDNRANANTDTTKTEKTSTINGNLHSEGSTLADNGHGHGHGHAFIHGDNDNDPKSNNPFADYNFCVNEETNFSSYPNGHIDSSNWSHSNKRMTSGLVLDSAPTSSSSSSNMFGVGEVQDVSSRRPPSQDSQANAHTRNLKFETGYSVVVDESAMFQNHEQQHNHIGQDEQFQFSYEQQQQQFHLQQNQQQIFSTSGGGPNQHVVVLHQQPHHLDASGGNGQQQQSTDFQTRMLQQQQPPQSFQPDISTPGHLVSGSTNNGNAFYVPFQQQSPQLTGVAPTTTAFNPKIFVGGLSWSSNEASLQHYFSKFGEVDSVEIMRDRLTGNPRGFAFVIFSHDQAVDRVLAHPKHIIDCKLVDVKRAHARSTLGASSNFSGGDPSVIGMSSHSSHSQQQQSVSLPASKSSSPVPHSFSNATSPPKANSPPDGFGVRSSASSPVNSVATNDDSLLSNHQYHFVTVAPLGGGPGGGTMGNHSSTPQLASASSTKPPLPDVQLNKIFVGGLHHAVDREELKHYFSKYGKVCDACVMFDPVTRRSRGFGFITYDTNDAAQRAMADQVHSFRDKTVELKLAQPKAGAGIVGPPVFAGGAMVTPTKGQPPHHHARAMSTIDFRPSGTPNHRSSTSTSRGGGGLHVRSSSAGADLFMINNTISNQTIPAHNSTHLPNTIRPTPSNHQQHNQLLNASEIGEHLTLEPLHISTSDPNRPLARRATSVGIEFSHASSSNHMAPQQQRHPNRGGSFVLKLQGNGAASDEGTLVFERASSTSQHHLPSSDSRRSAMGLSMNSNMARMDEQGEPEQHQGAMSELETALYRRVSQLEGQLANAQADAYQGRQRNVELQEHVQILERQVEETRRCERALISMLKDRTNRLVRLSGQPQDSSASDPETASRSSSVRDNPWSSPSTVRGASSSSAPTEADLDQLKSIVTGLNGRLGSHDADVSERLLVSALFAEGQTDQALMDVIVELDDRLASIEHDKRRQSDHSRN